jgi:hypothetical protein
MRIGTSLREMAVNIIGALEILAAVETLRAIIARALF